MPSDVGSAGGVIGRTPRRGAAQLVLLAALGGVLRLAYVELAPQKPIAKDAEGFRSLGKSLANAGHLSGRMTRGPVYPAFLGLVYCLGGDDQSVRRVQALVGGLTVALCGILGGRLGGGRLMAFSAAACAVHPALIAFTGLLLSENLAAPLIALTALLCVPSRGTERGHRASVGLGLSLGVCALCRPEALVLPIALLSAGFVRWRRRQSSPRTTALRWLVATGTMVAVVAPWTVRNYVVSGQFVPIAINGGSALWLGSTPLGWTHYHYEREPLRSLVAGLSGVEADRVLLKEGIHNIRNDPLTYVRRCGKRSVGLLYGEVSEAVAPWALSARTALHHRRYDALAGKGLFAALELLVALGVLACAGYGVMTRTAEAWQSRMVQPLALVIALCAIYTLLYATPRYKVPLLPVSLPLAWLGWWQLRLAARRRSAVTSDSGERQPPDDADDCRAAPTQEQEWEAAYIRFESPEEEIRKFQRRLIRAGARRWPREVELLDLFCGKGSGLAAANRLGFSAPLGVDWSRQLLTRHAGKGRLLCADCRRLPLRTDSRTVVTIHGGLHHLERLPDDLDLVLAEARRVLRPSGGILIVEPWLTPFLRVVHAACELPLLTRVSPKLEALATMVRLEGDTYRRWLTSQACILATIERHFVVTKKVLAWGKMLLVCHVSGA